MLFVFNVYIVYLKKFIYYIVLYLFNGCVILIFLVLVVIVKGWVVRFIFKVGSFCIVVLEKDDFIEVEGMIVEVIIIVGIVVVVIVIKEGRNYIFIDCLEMRGMDKWFMGEYFFDLNICLVCVGVGWVWGICVLFEYVIG